MTALSNDLSLSVKRGNLPTPEFMSLGVAASTTIYQGSLVCINSSGYATPGAATSTLIAIGRAEERVANTGSAGDKNVRVQTGVFKFNNSSSTDAITSVDVGSLCYVVDDQTVARTSSRGTRPTAGIVIEVVSDGVFVQLGVMVRGANIDLLLPNSAVSLAAKQYFFVAVNSSGLVELASGAGQHCTGVLQNAPGASGIAIVRISGISRCIAAGIIAPGAKVATDAAGKAKTAVLSDASAVGSNCMGIALNTSNTAADETFSIIVSPTGLLPATDA